MHAFTAPYLLKDLIDKNKVDVLHLYSPDARVFFEQIPVTLDIESYTFQNPTPALYSLLTFKPAVFGFLLGLDSQSPVVDPASYLDNGLNLLLASILTGQPNCVRMIIDSGRADRALNLPARDGEYAGLLPLTVAIIRGDLDSCQLMLAGGADPFLAQSSGATPLQVAVERGNQIVAAFLIEQRPADLRDYLLTPITTDELPLEYFARIGKAEVVGMLQQFVSIEPEDVVRPPKCAFCLDPGVRTCHVCERLYCPFHLRNHRHGLK
jgi:hypothetical protein